ncbi:MAG: hypothetical protein AABX11_00225 [Nanoarchaeota archaeon]
MKRTSLKGQLKIQEMAFVLVAVIIFFALVLLLYLSIRTASLQKDAQLILEDNARALLASVSRYPELAWSDCDNCIDLDKAIAFKDRMNSSSYANKWEVDYLMIERIYPSQSDKECKIGGYPSCSKLTLINATKDFGAVSGTFVSLCRWDDIQVINVCELGKIYASGRNINQRGNLG